jgi:hypothetical protein
MEFGLQFAAYDCADDVQLGRTVATDVARGLVQALE